ncbi:MAG: hypothetical protein H0V09_01980 [Gemmatimonadetes bacterium]|nr:hypothetical protein [Gemmatimonadota bacterium]
MTLRLEEWKMGRIDWGRVLLGGILAGLVINVSEMILNTVVMGAEFQEAMRARNVDPEGASIGVWIVYAFLLGIVAVTVYAAIRPRFGPGPRTALIAGFLVWVLTSLFSTIAMLNMGLFPGRLLGVGLVWALVELLLATLLGAWVYREAEAPRAASRATAG